MTDVKLSAETNHITTFDGNERIRVCDDPAGTPATGYVEIRDLFASDGWLSSNATWSYVSASSLTISGDVTSFIKKGTKLKLTQTTVKYFTVLTSVYSAPNTTITVAVNIDYTIANAAITARYSSNFDAPAGFPQRYNFTPAWTNLTVGNGTYSTAVFALTRERCFGFVEFVFGSTSGISAGGITMNVPIVIGATHTFIPVGNAALIDTGTFLYHGSVLGQSSVLTIRAMTTSGSYQGYTFITVTVPFTWATGDILTFSFDYPW